jgi:accessory gene regulator protein AgrB
MKRCYIFPIMILCILSGIIPAIKPSMSLESQLASIAPLPIVYNITSNESCRDAIFNKYQFERSSSRWYAGTQCP